MSLTVAYPDDLESCHRLLRERDKAIIAKDSLVEQQNQQLEEQKAALAKAIAERDLALQLAFRKKALPAFQWHGRSGMRLSLPQ